MIKLVPLENREKIKEICDKKNIVYNENVFAYIGVEGEKGLGIFSIDGYSMDILLVEYYNDLLLAELIVRAIANFGANRSVYLIKMKDDYIKSTLETLHFEKNDKGEYIGKIPNVLSGCCHCNK